MYFKLHEHWYIASRARLFLEKVSLPMQINVFNIHVYAVSIELWNKSMLFLYENYECRQINPFIAWSYAGTIIHIFYSILDKYFQEYPHK